MKNFMIFTILAMMSFSSFAADYSFRVLDCSDETPYPHGERSGFSMRIELKETQSAVNSDAFAKTFKADITFNSRDYSGQVKDITLAQEPSFYGYQLSFDRRILGSHYNSFVFLQPSFKGVFKKKLVDFSGNAEINVTNDPIRGSIVHTSMLVCQITE